MLTSTCVPNTVLQKVELGYMWHGDQWSTSIEIYQVHVDEIGIEISAKMDAPF